MKYIFLSLFISFTVSFSFNDSGISSIDKKVERRAQKIFGKNSVVTKIKHSDLIEVKGIIVGYEIMKDGNVTGRAYHGITEVCYFGGCSAYTDESKNVSREEVKYLIYLDENTTVKFIDIVDFESSYGYEIAAKWWLHQFYDKKPGNFVVGYDIDGISGATVSCQQMVATINNFQVK